MRVHRQGPVSIVGLMLFCAMLVACGSDVVPSASPLATQLAPPDTLPFPGRPWTLNGQPVSNEIIGLIAGPEHCGWERTLLLTVGWPLGRPAHTSDQARQYVRDPENVVPERLLGVFEPSTVLPSDAQFTGLRYGSDELWVSNGDVGEAVYLVRGGVVERWPRATELLTCA
jgi:hypothetical protein